MDPFETKFGVLVALIEVHRIGKNDGIIDFESMIAFEKINDVMARALIEIGAVVPKGPYHTWAAGKPNKQMINAVINSKAVSFLKKPIAGIVSAGGAYSSIGDGAYNTSTIGGKNYNLKKPDDMTGFMSPVQTDKPSAAAIQMLDFLNWLYEKTAKTEEFVKDLNLSREIKNRKINKNTIMFLTKGDARVLEKKGNAYRWDTNTRNGFKPTHVTAVAILDANKKYLNDHEKKKSVQQAPAKIAAKTPIVYSELSKMILPSIKKLEALTKKLKEDIEYSTTKLQQAEEAIEVGKKLLEFEGTVNSILAPKKVVDQELYSSL